MKVVIDMNLSPTWVSKLKKRGVDAIHWTEIGKANTPDVEIFDWAIKNNAVVFTHDLDFGTLLANIKTKGPSVIQIRTQDVSPDKQLDTIVFVLSKFADHINSGALITIDENKARVRILPV
ncbi:MAG: DUF5615 family PIN-like protein [Bacteroidales bacterium]|nr:DUF5615 family PIN-like protein [Bacteroidales bacterium]